MAAQLYNLYAEREACPRQIERWNDTLEGLARYVEAREETGTWPEGYDAVARPGSLLEGDTEGTAYLFTDGWEPLP